MKNKKIRKYVNKILRGTLKTKSPTSKKNLLSFLEEMKEAAKFYQI